MQNSDPNVGQKVADRYQLISLLGKGGMGVVYRGVHIATGRPVAVKLLSRDADDGAARRFLREARIAAKVSHPNLVDVIDVGKTEDGGMFLVLELLEGEALSGHIRRKGPMRPEDALDALVPIIDALGALHDAGVVHRDIKPSNIFLSLDGTSRVVPKLLDLGVSKPLDPGEALTETGMMLGTPHYMSPEQATGAVEVGVAADIWAMGVVLFEALTGDRPFQAETIPGLLHKIATDRPPRMNERLPNLPKSIASAIDVALAYEASSRHKKASDLADALVEGAIEAGWTLTCRMPSGPRISLAPFAPDLSPSDTLTPMLGSNDDPKTPMMTPRVDTRSVPAKSVASLTPIARASTDPGVDQLAETISRNPLPEPPITSPSVRVRQMSSSPLKIVLPIAAVLALGVVAWIAYASIEPEPRVRAPEVASQPPPEPIAQTQIDAGVVAAPPAEIPAPEVVAAEPVQNGPRRARTAPPPPDPPVQPVQPPPPREQPRVEVGTNEAPIIE